MKKLFEFVLYYTLILIGFVAISWCGGIVADTFELAGFYIK